MTVERVTQDTPDRTTPPPSLKVLENEEERRKQAQDLETVAQALEHAFPTLAPSAAITHLIASNPTDLRPRPFIIPENPFVIVGVYPFKDPSRDIPPYIEATYPVLQTAQKDARRKNSLETLWRDQGPELSPEFYAINRGELQQRDMAVIILSNLMKYLGTEKFEEPFEEEVEGEKFKRKVVYARDGSSEEIRMETVYGDLAKSGKQESLFVQVNRGDSYNFGIESRHIEVISYDHNPQEKRSHSNYVSDVREFCPIYPHIGASNDAGAFLRINLVVGVLPEKI